MIERNSGTMTYELHGIVSQNQLLTSTHGQYPDRPYSEPNSQFNTSAPRINEINIKLSYCVTVTD